MKKKIIFLLCLSVLTFANAYKNPFMLDDYAFFGSGRGQPLWSFFIPNYNAHFKLDSPQTDRTYYRPLAHVIPQVSYRLFGGNVAGHHALNLILMWLAACAVYIFLRSLAGKAGAASHDWFAFCAAALFVAHPVNGILINYITASVFSAQVLFMIGSLICLLESEDRKEKGKSWLLFSVFFFILSLLCHETAVLLPLFALIVLRLRMPWQSALRRILPYLAVLILYFIFRSYASPFNKSILYSFSILDLTWEQKAATVFKLLSWYLSKLFVPYSIFLMWSTPFVKSGVGPWIAGGLSIIGSLFMVGRWILTRNGYFHVIARSPEGATKSLDFARDCPKDGEPVEPQSDAPKEIASSPTGTRNDEGLSMRVSSSWKKRSDTRMMITFLLWFALGLTPIAAGAFVTPYVGGLIEPHWFVFATVGFFAAAAALIQMLPSIRWRNATAALIVSVLMLLSWRNNFLWSNEIAYYEAWLKDAPQFKAVHYFLGMAYVRKGEFDKAYPELEQTILGRYKDWMVYLELGQIDLKRRDLVRAEKNIMSAYQLESKHSGVLNAVGALHYKWGKLEEAKKFFERSIASNPGNLEPYMNLASYYKKMNEPQKAAEMYREILKINPQFTTAREALRPLAQLSVEGNQQPPLSVER